MVDGAFLRRYPALIWDFDGVIKESVEVKTQAFARLFAPFGAAIVARVRAHHRDNGGLSRFEKIPLYLQWAGLAPSAAEVQRYCAAFAAAVRTAVIDADWVPGVREYLYANRARQQLALVTATPQEEIEEIASALGIADCFRGIYGAPLAKPDALAALLGRWRCERSDLLMIGDSESDHAAALRTGIDFLLRRTPFNRALQQSYHGPQCENFLYEQMGDD
jgi:phosphoglycolate phosphatase-like HAD superfamily hydrolase